MKKILKLKISNLPIRKRLGSYDFDGFPKNAVLLELHSGNLWLNDNGLCGGNHYNLRPIHGKAIEVQSGAYVYYPSRRWVHDNFDMVGVAEVLGL